MDSCKPLAQTFNSFTAKAGTNKPRTEPFILSSEKSSSVAEVITSQSMSILDGFIGFLEVFVHQARDIHNICIYQNQDVYAKLCLTSDPEAAISTKIINGGGRYPVFNENIQLNVRTFDSSLKFEIWMLSRVRNYLEDQLLGFALVPLPQIVMNNGKLEQEFSLSSTDLFHSPAGFVSLTISYTGSTPKFMAIASPPESTIGDAVLPDAVNNDSIPCEYVNMEFPDLKIVNENKMMISEYLGIPCTNMESQNGECLISKQCDDCVDNDTEDKDVDIFSTDKSHISIGEVKNDSPLSSASTATSQIASEPSGITGSQTQKSKRKEFSESDTSSSADAPEKAYVLPVININIEPEQPVVQQEIVDLYMKSMQQFTESLAKMKLPMDIENNSSSSNTDNGNDTSDKKLQASEKTGSRVFYGSRAFF